MNLEMHPLVYALAESRGYELRDHPEGIDVTRYGDSSLCIRQSQGQVEARPVERGQLGGVDLRTRDLDLLQRFMLLRFGWGHRASNGLARIIGPIKVLPLPAGVELDTTDPMSHSLRWRDAAGTHEATNIGPEYAYYLGLSLPFTLEELDAAIRHPTGAPIFVPQPPFDASQLPEPTSPTEPEKRPRRPWFRMGSDR